MSPSHAERLAERRRDVQEQLAGVERQLVELRALRAGEHDDDEHDPDGAPASEEWSRLEGIRRSHRESLATIDVVAGRIADGVGHLCTGCGGPIAPGRLEARPDALTCIDCAR